LRVNQRNTEQCFVDNPDGDGHNELLILGPQDRNRGLHGDLVAVKLKSKEFWFLHEAYRAKYKLRFFWKFVLIFQKFFLKFFQNFFVLIFLKIFF